MPAEVERKLAAILSADIVGYSRLMTEDEDETVRRLAAYRTEVTNLVGVLTMINMPRCHGRRVG